MAKHGYGYVPDKQDDRDFAFMSARPAAAPLPPAVDLRKQCSPVRDQGQLGSCTGFAIAVGLREFLQIKLGATLVPMAPMFVYYEERLMEHDVNQDAGAQPRDGLKVLAKIGCAPEADDPYNIAAFTNKPSAKAVADAAQYKIAAYHRLKNLNDIQTCLAGGTGVVLGFKVYESFESNAVAQTGKMPMPASGESVVGGHAVFACGYQTDSGTAGGGYLIVKNSWGTGWGDNGYFYMPFAYVTPSLVSDAWTGLV
ncbi:MAG TPA: C1 family peptidase [Anaerolineaceae bacterium]|nr:C1 family peptidase [Anaerolineaceae bacterium]